MGPTTAVRSALRQYATFRGRARRSEYWWFTAFNAVVYILAFAVGAVLDAWAATSLVVLALSFGLLLPSVAVSVRRLHDIGRSGWWYLLGVTGIGVVILMVWSVIGSQPGPNSHGAAPKAPAPAAPGALSTAVQ